MKRSLLVFALFACASHLSAQTEVKLSPIPLLFGYVAASVEQGISKSFGIDGDFILIEDFVGGNISGKYYFDPEKGIDKFHVGVIYWHTRKQLALAFCLDINGFPKKISFLN